MELIRLSLRGIANFKAARPVVIDFASLGDGLIAIVGKNGEGKTSLLESPIASVFGDFPTKSGSLYRVAHGRDAFIESVWHDDGQELVARRQIDVEKRSTEKRLMVNGVAVKDKDYADAIRNRFGSLNLLLASVFMSQNKKGNFLLLPKGERKQLFAELLGLGGLTEISARSGDCRKDAEQSLATQQAIIAAKEQELVELLGAWPNVEILHAHLETLQDTHTETARSRETLRTQEADLIGRVERARGGEDELRALSEALATAQADHERAVDSRQDIIDRGLLEQAARNRQLDTWRGLIATLDRNLLEVPARYGARRRSLIARQTTLQATLGEAPAIEAARGELATLTAEQRALEAEEAQQVAKNAECAQARLSVTHASNTLQSAEVALKSLLSRRDTLVARLAEAVSADEARATIARLETEREEIGAAEQQLADLQTKHSTAKTELRIARADEANAEAAHKRELARLQQAAGRMSDGPCTAAEAWIPATDTDIELVMTPESKNILEMAYHRISQTFLVKFSLRKPTDSTQPAEKSYRIDGFPYTLWQQIKEAPSRGSFYAKNIKNQLHADPYEGDFVDFEPGVNGRPPSCTLSARCPLLGDARDAHAELQVFSGSAVHLELKQLQVATQAATYREADLGRQVEAQERFSVGRKLRFDTINKALREAHDVIAREAISVDHKKELEAIEQDIAEDKSESLRSALVPAMARLTELEQAVQAGREASTRRRELLLEIGAKQFLLGTHISRAALVEDAKVQLPIVDRELLGLDEEERVETTALEAKRTATEEQKQQYSEDDTRAVEQHAALIRESNERVATAAALVDTRNQALTTARERLASVDGLVAELAAVRAAIVEADQALATASTDAARLEAQIAEYRRKSTEVDALKIRAVAATGEIVQWGMLETAFGKDGIQALEIDAAGPEIARLANELLENCYGSPRWSIQFETQRENISQRGQYREVFDVRVFDRGQERDVDLLSGGEAVIIGESVGLSLAIYNARKNSIKYRTIVRDETVGQLDPENAQAYLVMLRRAMALGDFKQCVFVAHQPEVWQGADARVVVSNGHVSPN